MSIEFRLCVSSVAIRITPRARLRGRTAARRDFPHERSFGEWREWARASVRVMFADEFETKKKPGCRFIRQPGVGLLIIYLSTKAEPRRVGAH